MDVTPRDSRPILFSVIAAGVLVIAIAIFGLIRYSKTPFERAQERSENMNPQWVSIDLKTFDGRKEYREGEPIYLTTRFSSSMRYKYKVETAQDWNVSAIDTVHVSDGRDILLDPHFGCCYSKLIGMDDEGYTPPRAHTALRMKPGTYEIYLTSHRVFRWDVTPEEYHPSIIQVTSNMLKIRVVADPTAVPAQVSSPAPAH